MNILPSQQLSENECLEVYITEIPKIYKCYKSLPNKNFMKNPKIKELNDVLIFDHFYENNGTVTTYSSFCCRCNKYIEKYKL